MGYVILVDFHFKFMDGNLKIVTLCCLIVSDFCCHALYQNLKSLVIVVVLSFSGDCVCFFLWSDQCCCHRYQKYIRVAIWTLILLEKEKGVGGTGERGFNQTESYTKFCFEAYGKELAVNVIAHVIGLSCLLILFWFL